jgi:hypothetical protein
VSGCDLDPISAQFIGAIHGLVDALDNGIQTITIAAQSGYADADGQPPNGWTGGNCGLPPLPANPPSIDHGGVDSSFRQDDDKLLSAISHKQVRATKRLTAHVAETRKHEIPDLVAKAIIGPLEMIEIEKE